MDLKTSRVSLLLRTMMFDASLDWVSTGNWRFSCLAMMLPGMRLDGLRA